MANGRKHRTKSVVVHRSKNGVVQGTESGGR